MSSTAKNKSVPDKVQLFLDCHRIQPGSRIGIGLSGGADSVCLTLALLELKKERGFHLICCYLDHGIRTREENEGDRDFVTSLCRRHDIEIAAEAAEPGELKNISIKEKRSLEEVARERRYSFYSRVQQTHSLDYIAVGHTNDDLLETVTMRFFQGSNVNGLTGIPPRRGIIIRPLFQCTRQEITAFLNTRNQDWRFDSTNAENKYLRNQIRNSLLPVVRQIFPGYRKSLNTLVEKMTSFAELTEREMTAVLPWEEKENSFRIRCDDFENANEAVRLHTLYRMANMLITESVDRIPYHFFKPAVQIQLADKKMIIIRGHGMVFQKRGEYLFLERDVVLKRKKGYFIVVEFGINYLFPGDVGIRVDKQSSVPQGTVWVAGSSIQSPLIVRSRRPGDVILLQSGRKSIKKLFNEWQIPADDRSSIPIFEDRSGIVAVFGHPFGGRNRVRESDPTNKPQENDGILIFQVESRKLDITYAGSK